MTAKIDPGDPNQGWVTLLRHPWVISTPPLTLRLYLSAPAGAPPGAAPARAGGPDRPRPAGVLGQHLPLGAPNITEEGHCGGPQKGRERCGHRRPRRLPMPKHVSARPPLDATEQ